MQSFNVQKYLSQLEGKTLVKLEHGTRFDDCDKSCFWDGTKKKIVDACLLSSDFRGIGYENEYIKLTFEDKTYCEVDINETIEVE